MIDVFIVVSATFLFLLGDGNDWERGLIALYLWGSAFFALTAMVFNLMGYLDPWLFYANFMLSILCAYVILFRAGPNARALSVPLIATSLLCFIVFIEYYIDSGHFYDIYSEAMLCLTAWQLWQLIRVGDVGGNLKRWARGDTFSSVRGDRDKSSGGYFDQFNRSGEVSR